MSEELLSKLSDKEKSDIIKNTFEQNKNSENTIDNIGDYISSNFAKIDGFDYRWNSLITSKPLLFEDADYLRCREYIKNIILPEEIEAYKSGKLRELYATFENMLMCNLAYYDRIMSFCTMVILHYVRIEDEITNYDLEQLPFYYDLTPTKIWCCAMTGLSSTEYELKYSWGIFDLQHNDKKSLLENNWNKIYQNKVFAKFIEYAALRNGTSGFTKTLVADVTSNRKLSLICAKFTRTSVAIGDDQLNNIYEYVCEIESISTRLHAALRSSLMKIFNDDESQFAIFIYSEEFYLHTSKFSMKVSKDTNGKISKDYLANSYECFIAEEFLSSSIKMQIEWARYKIPLQFEYDLNILLTLLNNMMKDDFRKIVALKRMNAYGTVSTVRFAGVFDKVFIHEELIHNGNVIKSNKPKCLSKENAALYIVKRGYYLFGLDKDALTVVEANKTSIVNHYLNYCIPILNHMKDVISTHIMSKNDIIDVVCSGILNPNKINNKNIRYTNAKSNFDSKKIIDLLQYKNKITTGMRKSYWRVIGN